MAAPLALTKPWVSVVPAKHRYAAFSALQAVLNKNPS